MAEKWIELHELIHAMTRSEKGYFKKYNTGYSGTEKQLYQKLFDLIAKSSALNEKLISSKFRNQVQNMHSIRSFLYQQIVKSLRAFHTKKNIAFELREMLDKIDLLNTKALQKHSIKIAEKGILIAHENNMQAYKVLFLYEKRQMLKFFQEQERQIEADEIHHDLVSSATRILNNELIKQAHLKSIYWLNTQLPLRNEAIKLEAEKSLKTLLEMETISISNYNEINIYYAALSNISSLLNQLKEAVYYQKKTIELMESLDLRKLNRVLSYAAAIFNLASSHIFAKDIESITKCLFKLKSIEAVGEVEQNYIEALVALIQLHLAVFSKKSFSQKQATQIELFLKKPHPIPNIFFDTQFLLLTYYIKYQRWNDALSKVNMLLQANYKHSQVSFLVHVRLLQVLIQYKMGNFLLLPFLIRNTYRFMAKQELLYQIEKQILHFFRKILSVVDQKLIIKRMQELQKEIRKIALQKDEARIMDIYFNYLEWLEVELKTFK